MRYKEDNDNRYRVNFMRATEELMDVDQHIIICHFQKNK